MFSNSSSGGVSTTRYTVKKDVKRSSVIKLEKTPPLTTKDPSVMLRSAMTP
jgi:hypothetical protein